jgi:uncharacterized membrane protein
MDIKLKLIISFAALFVILYFMACPVTGFAKWGERVCGSYGALLITILCISLIPIITICVYWIWTL